MAATKISLANGALRLLKERQLSPTELTGGLREPARVFNAIWDDGAVRACLEAGQWKFAKRSALIDHSPSVDPGFGFTYAFDKPDDWVRTIGVWSDATMGCPLRDYRDEAGFWFANQETIYVSFVSDGPTYGGDFSLWPQSFVKFVQAHIAADMAGPMTDKGEEMLTLRKRLLNEALSTDAMADPSRNLPVGTWIRARMAGRTRYGER